MQYLIIYVASILVSLGMDFDFALQFVKDIADAGGKVNIDKLSEISELLPEYNKKISKVVRFIPIVNVCYSIANRLSYEVRRNDLLMQLNIMGAIDKMTDEEIEEYNKKPTRLNAMKCMSTKQEVRKVVAEKMSEVPTDEELPENRIVLTIGDEAYSIAGDNLDEQFDNVFLAINIYEDLLTSKEYSDTDGVKELSEEQKKQKLAELKSAKLQLMRVRKQVKKQEKKLKKIKK